MRDNMGYIQKSIIRVFAVAAWAGSIFSAPAQPHTETLYLDGEEYSSYLSYVEPGPKNGDTAVYVAAPSYPDEIIRRHWPVYAFMWTPISSIFAVMRDQNSHLTKDSTSAQCTHRLVIRNDIDISGVYRVADDSARAELILYPQIMTKSVKRAHFSGLGFVGHILSLIPLVVAPMETDRATVTVRMRVVSRIDGRMVFDRRYSESESRTSWLLFKTNQEHRGMDDFPSLLSRCVSRFIADAKAGRIRNIDPTSE